MTSQKDMLVRILTEEHTTLVSGLKNIQTNLSSAVGNNQESLENFEQIKNDFSTLVDSAVKVNSLITNLAQRSTDSLGEVELLTNSVKKIKHLLKSIEGISNQTNLLALNATIEASRAGEHGKGFAVVAREIKGLSSETKKSVRVIAEAISEIVQVEEKIRQNFHHTNTTTQEINEFVNEFNEQLKVTSNANLDSIENMLGTNDQIFLALAKLDHVIWKVNTYISVLASKPEFEFVDHHSCRLGKWYLEGDGKNSFADISSYSDLEYPHSLVHNGTKEIFDQMKTGHLNEHSLIKSLQKMEKGSQQVFEILDKMLKEKIERGHHA
jgi:hypothetical protein